LKAKFAISLMQNFRRSQKMDAELIQQVAATSIAEIDRLIAELQETKNYLQSEGERIEREIVRYTDLTQMASFTAEMISDAVSQWLP